MFTLFTFDAATSLYLLARQNHASVCDLKMLRRLAQSTTAAHDLITGMIRVPVDVRTARAFTGLIERAVAAAAGINLQQRFMSVFKDEHDASAAERANEGLVPRPLDPAQTATVVEMLKVGLGLASSHPPTSLFLLVWLPTFASARLTDHRRLAVPQPSLFPQICSVIRNDLSFALCLWHCLLVAVWFVLATLPAARSASRQPRTRAEQWDVRASARAFSFAFSISLHA